MKGEKALNGVVLICNIKAQLQHCSTWEELLLLITAEFRFELYNPIKKGVKYGGF